jgi:hypothetical protein
VSFGGVSHPAFSSIVVTQLPIDAPRLIPQCILQLGEGNLVIFGWIIITIVDTSADRKLSPHWSLLIFSPALISMIVLAKFRMYRSFTAYQNDLLNHIYRDALIYFFCNFREFTDSDSDVYWAEFAV